MAIKETKLGKIPVADVADDMTGAMGRMVDGTQWDFDGKDLPAAFEMLNDTAEKDAEQAERRKDKIGFETFTNAAGQPFEALASRESLFQNQPGYNQARVRPGITVPNLPWQKDRLPGERYADYIARRDREAAAKGVKQSGDNDQQPRPDDSGPQHARPRRHRGRAGQRDGQPSGQAGRNRARVEQDHERADAGELHVHQVDRRHRGPVHGHEQRDHPLHPDPVRRSGAAQKRQRRGRRAG